MALASIYTQVKMGTKGIDTGLNAAYGKIMKGGKVMGGLLLKAGALAAAGIGAVAGILGKAAIESSKLTEAMNALKVVFNENEQAALNVVNTLNEFYGMSKRQAADAIATMGGMFEAMSISEKKSLEMAEAVAILATDLGSLKNMDTSQVLLDIRSAMAGSMETMDKYGIVLRQSAVDQKVLTMGLAETKKEITPAARAMATLKLIIEQSGSAIGDFERSAGTLQNTLKKLRARLEDAWATLGQKFEPVLEDMLQIALDVTEAFIDWASESDNLARLAETLTSALGFLVEATMTVVDWVNKLVEGYKAAMEWFQEFANKIYDLSDKGMEIVTEFFGVGSDKKYLSEKIKELEFSIEDFSANIEAQSPEFTVDMSSVHAEIDSATQKMHTFTAAANQAKSSLAQWNESVGGGGSSWTGPSSISRNYDWFDPNFWAGKYDQFIVQSQQDMLQNRNIISTTMGLAQSVNSSLYRSYRNQVAMAQTAQELARWNSYSDAWNSAGRSSTYILQPTYMTGSRQSANEAAQSLSREQNYYNRRTW